MRGQAHTGLPFLCLENLNGRDSSSNQEKDRLEGETGS